MNIISESYAQSTGSAAATNDPGMLSFAPLVLIFAIFYFLPAISVPDHNH